MCMFMIQNRTKRTEKLPCSFLRQNRKEKEFFSVHFTLQRICHYRHNEKNREITLLFSQTEQKWKRNFSCSFFLATPRFAFMMTDSLWSDIELRDLFQDSWYLDTGMPALKATWLFSLDFYQWYVADMFTFGKQNIKEISFLTYVELTRWVKIKDLLPKITYKRKSLKKKTSSFCHKCGIVWQQMV